VSEFHVKGLTELNKFLQQLPEKLQKNVMRGAMRAGMNVIKPVAKRNIHSVSGLLAEGLRVEIRAKGPKITVKLKATGKHGFVAQWVEFGTKAHFIKVRDEDRPVNLRRSEKLGRTVRVSISTINRNSLRIGGRLIGPTVHHPGARLRPFMRPALDSHGFQAVSEVARYMKLRLATKHGLDTSGVKLFWDE
jgi:HK97 gp10 family phage protein